MQVESSTPCRIDLAGGTLDIYPLYLFMEGGLTVNVAIDLLSWVRLEGRDDREIHLASEDTAAELTAASIEDLPLDRELSLVARTVKFYGPETGINVTTRNTAPHGSGLGSSSALLIALSGALREFNHLDLPNQRIIDNAVNLEAQVIRIPTGKQDYYPAMYGGVNAVWFRVDGESVESLIVHESGLSELEQRLVLSFTGESRFSGTNNWRMMRAYIDGRGETVASLNAIKETALRMREALAASDYGRFAELIDEEWQNRKRLAKGVTTGRIDRLMAAARSAGALASKICGAGGGGCMVSVVEPRHRGDVEQTLTDNGAQVLPFHIARRGLTIMRDSER
jgi:D-glycero-alpha-D-manno-heptose-7-phosphate kinase